MSHHVFCHIYIKAISLHQWPVSNWALQATQMMWNLPTSPGWPSKFCHIFKQKWAALFLNVSTTPRLCMLVLRHTNTCWMRYMLMLIQMADVFQRNSSLVALVERNGCDSALSPAPGSGPRAAALITTCTPGHQPPLHFNRNPQICCEWSPLGGFFPFITTVQSAAAPNLLNLPKKNVHLRTSTGNERWMEAAGAACSPLWHTSPIEKQHSRVLQYYISFMFIILCLLHS